MKRFPLLVLAVAFAGVSCERHEFEGPDGTKQLHENHAAPGHDSEGAGHADPAGHEAEKKHEEKPAH